MESCPRRQESWLQPNRRALWFGSVPPLMIGLAGGWLAIRSGTWGSVGFVLGAALAALSVAALIAIARQITRPRIAYRDGQILFNLRSGAPIAVPVEVVEAFFLGQGPAKLPGDYRDESKSVNLVAWLSRRHADWAQREVRAALGSWKDGYITIRGTWCEPLDAEVVRRLNRRLKEVKA